MDYRPREVASYVARATAALPAVVLTGLRQSGKTTFLRQDPLFANWRYLTLDEFAVREAALQAPEALLESADRLILDEAQQAPELLRAVKQSVDRDRRPGRFVLSGSANFALLRDVSESLAGRALYVELQPLSRRERLGASGVPLLSRLLDEDPAEVLRPLAAIEPMADAEVLLGGFPTVALGQTVEPELFFLGYEQTYLERDVRAFGQVADLVGFRQILRLAALRTGQLLNMSELGRDAKMPASTVQRYLHLLEASFVLARVQPHLSSPVTRLVKSPKAYLSDAGLAAFLTGTRALQPEDRLRGPLWETYLHQQLAAWRAAHRPTAQLRFWNVQGRHEVDFVIETAGRSLAIELKAGSRFGDRDLQGLRTLVGASPDLFGVLAYNGREPLPLGDRLFALPIVHLLS